MKKLIFTFILATLCGISAFAALYDFSARCSSGQILYYKIYNGVAYVTYQNETISAPFYSTYPTGDLVIPSSVVYNGTTYTVKYIYSHAFQGCSGLTSVTIPNSVTEIESWAFYGCSGLTSITIGNGITKIGDQGSNSDVFYGCSSLTRVNYAGTIAKWCGITFANEECNPLKYAHNLYIDNTLVTDLTIPNTITSIKSYTFCGATCLASVTFPNTLTTISGYAFSGCTGLTSITIPNSCTSIGPAFSGCSGLTEMTMPYLINFQHRLFGAIFGAESYSGGSAVTQYYYEGGSRHNVTYYIPSRLRSVNITSIISPSGVISIPYGAFSNCSMLTSVTIPNSVTSIGEDAFYGCSGLTSVTIGNSVTSIGGWAFAYCNRLTAVYFTGSIEQWCGITFASQTSQPLSYAHKLYIDNELVTNLVIPETITVIKDYAFYSCRLTSVTIPNSVTAIGYAAFVNCSGLTDIYANPTTPPTLPIEPPYSFDDYTATVWVPCGSLEAYQSAARWMVFSDIRERFPYTLNVSSADSTMGTASVTQQPDCTEEIAIIAASPNRGYAFVQWNDGNTDNPRTVNVTASVEYTASFVALPTYRITAESADETRGTVTGGGIYYANETATLTATPNGGYTFGSWNDGNTSNPRTITVTGNVTYTATFMGLHTITVSSANTNMGTVSGGGTYTEGSPIEISATPAVHHHFVQWNDGNAENPRTITVVGDATYTASFAIDQHIVTVVSADESMGSVSMGGIYDYGTEIQISATPAEGYGFATWNDGNTDNPRTVTVSEDITYTATFGAWRTITIVSADETQGTVQGTGEYIEGTTIQITAIPNEHYHFVHWIDEENPTRDFNTDNPRTITVTGNMTYTAVFAINQHTITVESADEAMGTVSGGGTFPFGTEIQISATASENYRFVAWTDGSTDNPRTVRVVGDAEYVAAFSWDAGIEENAVSEIALFPNPVTDILNITSSEPISEIEIVNVMGQVVRRVEVNADNAVCDVEDLKSGVYVVRIRTLSGVEGSATLSQQRFVKE